MKKILLLCLLSISFSQEIDYSDMSSVERMMMYDMMKKSPICTGFLEGFVPTAGYAYTGQWKRGLKVRIAYPILTGLPFIGLSYAFGFHNEKSIIDWMGASFAFYSLYSFYDVANQISKYNDELFMEIFGKKKNKMKASLYPLQDGAGISLTYLIN